MNNGTKGVIESFQLKSNDIISILFKLQKAIGSSQSLINNNEDAELSNLLDELNSFMLNDDLISLVKDQQYELICLNEKHSNAKEEIARLEEERETLNEKIQSLMLNQQEADNDKDYSLSLQDYNNLKEEYLQLYALNQQYEQKYAENEAKISSYQQLKENLYLMTYSYEGLQTEYDSQCKELNERIAALLEENAGLKEQIREELNNCSVYETQKKDHNTKINSLNRKNRQSISKIRTMEKANSLIKNNNSFLKTKLSKTREDNEKKIEEMKLSIQALEEKNIALIDEKRTMSKDICKEFLREFENKKLSFHYINNENMIAIYFAEELIGEVRNKSMNSIKRNQSNKIILKYKYLLTDYPEVDRLLSNKKKTVTSLEENTLKHLNAMDESSPQRKDSNSSKNHLNLLSWDCDNQLTFAKRKISRITVTNANHCKGVSSFTTDMVQNKTEEEGNDSNASDCAGEYIELDKDDTKQEMTSVKDKEEADEEEEKAEIKSKGFFSPKSRIELNSTSPLSLHLARKHIRNKYCTKNYYDVNNTHIEKGDVNQVIRQETIKENKCFYCVIF